MTFDNLFVRVFVGVLIVLCVFIPRSSADIYEIKNVSWWNYSLNSSEIDVIYGNATHLYNANNEPDLSYTQTIKKSECVLIVEDEDTFYCTRKVPTYYIWRVLG